MQNNILEKYAQDKEIIRLTIEQIKKDFGGLLPEIILSGNPSTLFDELKNQIAPVIESLRKNNRTMLRVLLYKIDLKESAISSATNADLAEKIIRREFQKILMRKHFSS
jgi:hypothetical protein